MTTVVDSDLKAIRESFGSLFAKEAGPQAFRNSEPDCFARSLWDHLVGMEAPGVGVAEEFGGGGAGLTELAIIAEEQGRALATVPFVETAVLARALASCHARDLLANVLDGSLVATYSPVPLAPGRRTIPQVPYGAIADVLLVASGERLVAIRRGEATVGNTSANLASLPLADWAVASGSDAGSAVADGETGRAVVSSLSDDWKILTAALLVGMADGALRLAVEYAQQRVQFGAAIGRYQAIAHRLATCATNLDGSRLLVLEAARTADGGSANGAALAAMALAFTSETAELVAETSLHVHGGYGFMLEYDVQLYLRRIKACVLSTGEPWRSYQHVANALLGGEARQ